MDTDSVEDLLQQLRAHLDADGAPALLPVLRAVVDWLRPDDPLRADQAVERIRIFHAAITADTDLHQGLQALLQEGLGEARHLPLYTEIGLFSRRGFLKELGQRVYEKINPRPRDPQNLRDVLALVFDHPEDPQWVVAVPDDAWLMLLDCFEDLGREGGPALKRAREQVLYALEMLSLWVAAEELEPELLRLDPRIAERNSPFVAQEREISAYVKDYNAWLEDPQRTFHDDRHARVLLEQCAEQIQRFHRRAVTHGSSIGLTHLLQRLDQTLTRMRDLLNMLDPEDPVKRRCTAARLFRALVVENARQRCIKALWQDSVRLVSRSITEQSGETGEHYITRDRREYLQLLASGAGAGLVIALMALIKIHILQWDLSPGWETVWVCLNYGLGFVLIHVLHFTVATKQPAMTAARLSAVIEAGERGAANQTQLAELLLQVGRSQFAAVLGNVGVALPVALGLGWAALNLFGTPLVETEQAHYLLHGLRPLAGLALFYAAIAGVWLFVSGLIAGYFDNRCASLQLGARLRDNPHLARVLSPCLRQRLADYLDHNYGALAGNFLFGVLLGITGWVGLVLGLPLDIRHVAFASANLGYATSVQDLTMPVFALHFLFVLLIGAVNLWVSFALALYVALRSRGVRLGDLRQLSHAYVQAVRRRPLEFILPPVPEPEDPEAAHGSGKPRNDAHDP